MKAFTYSAFALSLFSSSLALSQGDNAANASAQEDSQEPKAQALRVVNRVAASVNGRPITSSEVRARLSPIARELSMLHPSRGSEFSKALIDAKKHIIQELIERELIMFEFVTLGYHIPETNIVTEINNRILMRYGGDRDKFIQVLRQGGISFSEYKESVRKEMSVSAIRGSKYEYGVIPTPDELRDEYNRTKSIYRDVTKDRVSYDKIYIPSGTGDPNVTPEQQMQHAQQVAKELRIGGITFADAAKQFSRDTYAAEGGKWPLMARFDLAPEFASIVFDAEVGKIIGPLLDASGFTILKVNRHILSAPPSLEDAKVKAMVEASARRTKSEIRYREWLKEIRKHAVIRVFI